MSQDLKSVIEAAWENRDAVNVQTTGEVREAVDETLNQLDSGTLRVASREADGTWVTHQWAKQAILLSFRLNANQLIDADAPHPYWDKIPLKFTGWDTAALRPPASGPCRAASSAAAPISPRA